MTLKINIWYILILALMISLAGCIDEKQHPPLSKVSKVDINRYLGLWYEIARIDHSFLGLLLRVIMQRRLKDFHR